MPTTTEIKHARIPAGVKWRGRPRSYYEQWAIMAVLGMAGGLVGEVLGLTYAWNDPQGLIIFSITGAMWLLMVCGFRVLYIRAKDVALVTDGKSHVLLLNRKAVVLMDVKELGRCLVAAGPGYSVVGYEDTVYISPRHLGYALLERLLEEKTDEPMKPYPSGQSQLR